MGLKIYESANPTTAFSVDGSFANPLLITADGMSGITISKRLYIRNDNALFYYTDIALVPVVNSGLDIVTGVTDGFYWKLMAGDTQPLEDQWDLVPAGNSITLADIGSSGNGNTSTYSPFWLRIKIPRNVDVQSFENVSLEITANENSV